MSFPYDSDRPSVPLEVWMDRAGQKKAGDPSSTSHSWDVMSKRWELINYVLGGTEAMRSAGLTILPKHSAESPIGWENRRKAAVLTNITEITVESLTGKPFAEDIKLNADIPEQVGDLLEDVDMCGTNMDSFARAAFRSGLAKGFIHVLVDFPEVVARADGQPRTLEDDRTDALRPYFVMIQPEDVIFASSTIVGGKEMLTQVRIFECITTVNDFVEESVHQIRVLTPGQVDLWIDKNSNDSKKKPEWVKQSSTTTSLNYIPMHTFYASERAGLHLCKPPIMDLVHLNIAHYQSCSDQRNCLTVARFPMLAVSGVDDEAGILRVGPNQILTSPDSQAKFYYVEHTGAALATGQTDINELEVAMAQYGAQFLKTQPDRVTATARSLDSAEALSPLQAMVKGFQDFLARCLDSMADWQKLGKPGGTLELNTAFGLDQTTQWDVQTLADARATGNISRVAYLTELKRRRILSQDYDIELDADQLKDEMALELTAPIVDKDPAAPAAPPAKKKITGKAGQGDTPPSRQGKQ